MSLKLLKLFETLYQRLIVLRPRMQVIQQTWNIFSASDSTTFFEFFFFFLSFYMCSLFIYDFLLYTGSNLDELMVQIVSLS